MIISLDDSHVPIRLQQILAQAVSPSVVDLTQSGQAFDARVDYLKRLTAQIVAFLPSVLAALAFPLALDYLKFMAIAQLQVRRSYARTSLPDALASLLPRSRSVP